MVAVLEEKGLRKMARRVYEPCNRRERGRVAETEVEVVKTEVEEVAAVKVATKVELGVAFRMDPHGRIYREGGKESAVCWAQAGCTLRCKSGMGVAWQDGGSVYELLRSKKSAYGVLAYFVRDGYILNKWQCCNRRRKWTKKLHCVIYRLDCRTQSMDVTVIRNPSLISSKYNKFCHLSFNNIR